MKKLLKVGITVFSLVAILGMSKATVLANEKVINEVEEATSRKIVTEEEKEETFTYRLIVDRLDYLSFRKGHDGEYTLVYSVNGGQIGNYK